MSTPVTKHSLISSLYPSSSSSKSPSPLCSFLFFILLCILTFYTLHHPHFHNSNNTLYYHSLFLSSSSNSTISSYLYSLTRHSHLAGTKTSFNATSYVHSHFISLGLESYVTNFTVLLSYPTHSSLSAQFSNGSSVTFSLKEGNNNDVIQPYHAYSPSGEFKNTKVVFVNYGREIEYRTLEALGVQVKGCIVLVRKGGGMSRGEIVRIAESKRALAVLLYAERNGKYRDAVERGTVMNGVGDPLSPGWGSSAEGERLGLNDSEVLNKFPKIPSLPLSFENAELILSSLGGPVVENWRVHSGRVVRVGPGPSLVNFSFQGEMKEVMINDVFAVIKGAEEPDRFVILGNHRDAWSYGAVDPNSGTAALLDIARRYALLMKMGWKPQRTIVLCSWDAEEFGMVGSTEWVEQNLLNLGAKAVAYLNVDCAVEGPGFFAGATPQLDNILREVTKKVEDPDSEGAMIYDKWAATNQAVKIERLGRVDSDFAPFLHHAGVPSIDIYYGSDFPVYHTAFDSYEWMTENGDPLFHRHVAVAGVWGLLGLRLADDSILPFDYLSYAEQLQEHAVALRNLLGPNISLNPLSKSIQRLASAAKDVQNEAMGLRLQESGGDFVALKFRALNDRLMLAERGFLDADGLQGRHWFKHLIYGPRGDYKSELGFFPGIADAINESRSMNKQDREAAIRHEMWRVARAIERAAAALEGQLF